MQKLFGNFERRATPSPGSGSSQMNALEWVGAVAATLFYGPIALLAILWILFTSSLSGVIIGLMVLGLCLGFGLPRRTRPVALVVLALLAFLLGTGITLVVAVQEGVPPVLLSLVTSGGLVWLAVRRVFSGHRKPLAG